jgi:aspartate aminotransferase
MTEPSLSAHFRGRSPSAIRVAGIRFAERTDDTEAINVAIGNVSLPMHPAMIERLSHLRDEGSPFRDGVVQYTSTVGLDETRRAFLHTIASCGLDADGLHCQITDGGSQAMELVTVGLCGPAGGGTEPLLLIDAAYTNYLAFAQRLGRPTVSITRTLGDDGKFALPDLAEIERVITAESPAALVVIPYDNPTGQFYDQDSLDALARLCVKHDLWMVSDEAYRQLFYTDGIASSIWAIDDDRVPGIRGRRISIESTSKVWNACGLRIGALVTDNAELHRQAVAENTASLCPSAIGQWIFGAIAHVSHADLNDWYGRQRAYYRKMLERFTARTRELLPESIVSSPDASIYSVVDVRKMTSDFDALEFVLWCATDGQVEIDGRAYTLLVAPMGGFYATTADQPNPGRTQMRIAYVETPERMELVPDLLASLLPAYLDRAGAETGERVAGRG